MYSKVEGKWKYTGYYEAIFGLPASQCEKNEHSLVYIYIYFFKG
jgi:hypothetical protein